MSVFESMILGLIQGLTEFLPISSSGHLVLFQKLFGLHEANMIFDTMLHLGTLLAVFIIFWDDIVFMVKKPLSKLSLLVIVGTIPTAIIGLALKDFFERVFASGQTLGIEFLATGLILLIAEKMPSGRKGLEEVSYKDALLVGTLQGVAILPAVSRSGLTIAGCLFRGVDRETAARYSFLLSIPAILGAAVLQIKDLMHIGLGEVPFATFGIGTLMSAIAGYFAIKFMIQLIQRGSLKVFTYYVWILGIGIIIAQLLGKF